jgi:hypothetical protein
MGKRIDVPLLVIHVTFILEFKIGSDSCIESAVDQVWDYTLDLKNFHENSRHIAIVPILFANKAQAQLTALSLYPTEDMVSQPHNNTNNELLFDSIHHFRFQLCFLG